MFQALVEMARLVDILVNNAGITRDGLLGTMSLKDWQDHGDQPDRRVSLPGGGR